MDTKLKKLTKHQQEIVLFAGWVLVTVLLCMAGIHGNNAGIDYLYSSMIQSIFCIAFVIELILGLLLAGFLAYGTWNYLKNFPPREHMQHKKVDDWSWEGIVIAELVVVLIWSRGLPGTPNSPYVFGYYVPDTVSTVLQYVLAMTVFTSMLYVGALLLVRHGIWKNWMETSFIYGKIQRYRMRTSLEKQIADRSKGYFWTFLVLCILNVVCAFACLRGWYNFFLLQVVFFVAGIVVFLIYFCKNRIYRDAVKLARQIDAMTQGEDIPEDCVLSEQSLFAPCAEKLANIEDAMKKSMEKQVQAERLKIDLVTNVSHDLKTPLTSMIGYADLLKKEELSPEAMDYVEAISAKQEQLKDMIQDLFELAKSTSNTEQLHMETLDMTKLMNQVLADMEDSIAKSHLSFRSTFTKERALFLGDNGKMYRVVQNLLENVLKYALEGTRVYIAVERDGKQVEMSVKNISACEMNFTPEEIMERFNRGDESRTTEGHGLGLAIASSFTQNMGGTMQVEIDGDLFKVTIRFPEAAVSETTE